MLYILIAFTIFVKKIMGYRINISNANSIGHLIEGNIMSFLHQTFLDENYLQGNIEYLDELLSEQNRDFISSHQTQFNSSKRVLANEWDEIKIVIRNAFEFLNQNSELKENLDFDNKERVLFYLKKISSLLGRYKIKFLILPGFDDNNLNTSLVDRDALIDWLRAESFNSYLIIQLKQIPNKNDIQILNSFNHFESALKRVDEWPGALIWTNNIFNSSRSIFIPIKSIRELKQIIAAQKYEKAYMNYLISNYGAKSDPNITQLIHLSDLHLGLKGEDVKLDRLIDILKTHRRQANASMKIYPMISGDLVDTPTVENANKVERFIARLKEIGYEEPITILGNHDYNNKGIRFKNNVITHVAASLSSTEKVKIIDELKLIIIRFDSNAGGKVAQGEIGIAQLAKIGSLLDAVENLDKYTVIGMLHHHPFKLETPNWMKKTWYEYIFGNSIVNGSLKLVDSDLFLEWIKDRGIKFIMHGHKHIPVLFNKEGINIISAGSSTGNIKHKNPNKTYLTYNVINYHNKIRQPVSSAIIFEELLGSGTRHLQIVKY